VFECCAAALQHRGIVPQPSLLVAAHLSSGALIDFLFDASRMRAWPA
jgi:hypothetical protein